MMIRPSDMGQGPSEPLHRKVQGGMMPEETSEAKQRLQTGMWIVDVLDRLNHMSVNLERRASELSVHLIGHRPQADHSEREKTPTQENLRGFISVQLNEIEAHLERVGDELTNISDGF